MANLPENLNPEEQTLIDEHLEFYSSLADGTRLPTSTAQEHFVCVCQGKASAETPHEIAFMKFQASLSAEQERLEEEVKRLAEQNLQAHLHRLQDYYSRQNDSMMECDDDRWW